MGRHLGLPLFHLYGDPPDDAAFDFIHIETITSRAPIHDWTIRAHRHRNLFQILAIERGGGDMLYEATKIPFAAPAAILVQAAVAHGFRFQPQVTQGWVLSFTEDAAGFLTERAGEALSRLRALAVLVAAGVKASVGMAPILPGLSDRPDLLADVVRAAREAGATGVWANLLHLRPGTKEHFLTALERDWPELLPEYEQLYGGRAYLSKADSEPARSLVRDLAREHDIRDRRPVKLAPPPEPTQLELAV